MIEVPDVRRRVRAAIENARRNAQQRRARIDEAAAAYEGFLRGIAVPVFQVFAAALVAEGYRFQVSTPADSVRLSADARPDDYIELVLDTEADPPEVLGRSSRGRGRRQVTSERPVREGTPVQLLTEEDVLAFLTIEILPFVER